VFDFSKDDFLTSADLSKAILRSSRSERKIKKTSINELGYTRSSLTTADVGEVFTGALNTRNLFYSQNFLQDSIKSSLDSVISNFANTESISIESPEGYGTLTGSLAANRILAESLVYKKGFQSFGGKIDSEISNLVNASFSEYQSSFETRSNSAATSAGAMTVALEPTLAEMNVLSWYRSRHLFLQNRMEGEFDVPVNGFNFKLNNSFFSDGNTRNVTITNFPGLNQNASLDPSLASDSVQVAYLSASLTELLIFLEKECGIILGGSFGVNRAVNPSLQGSSFQGSSDSVSDHVFGRAFDIHKISRRGNRLVTISQESTQYRQQLEVFLEALNTVPEHLMPDLIVIHPNLSSIYEINSGFEQPNTAIKRKYPRLRYVDFETSQEHRAHIHISFSAERAGIYTGPSGALIRVSNTVRNSTRPQNPPSQYQHTPYNFRELSVEETLSWYKNYANSPTETITRDALFDLLRSTVMSDEAAALFIGIVARESGLRPVSINGGWRQSGGNYSGEYSIGMFQINLRTNAHGTKRVSIPYPASRTPYEVDAWTLTCLNHPSFNTLNVDNVNDFLRNTLGKVNERSSSDAEKISYANTDIWVPYNQMSLLYTAISQATWNTSSPKLDPKSYGGHIFFAWGDYRGGLGFLHRVDYNTVMQIYLRSGKSESQFQEWFKSWFNDTSIVSSSLRLRNENINPEFIQRINYAPANPSYYSGPRVVNSNDFPYPLPRTIGEIAVNIAFGQILKPYRKNVNANINSSTAFDCSGLTRYAWYNAVRYYNSIYGQSLPDILLPWNSNSQATTSLTTLISLGDQPPENVLKAGDLIVRDGHVGMYMGGSKLIHAVSESIGIVSDDWSTRQRFDGTSFRTNNSLTAPGSSGFWRFPGDTQDPSVSFARVLDIVIANPVPMGGFQG
jgi:cell wall-associated NlpC family hydrolase